MSDRRMTAEPCWGHGSSPRGRLRRRASFLGQMGFGGGERGFRRAIELDPDYAHAHLWLAQTLEWGGRPVASWSHSRNECRRWRRLGFRERALARALADLATQSLPKLRGVSTFARRDSLTLSRGLDWEMPDQGQVGSYVNPQSVSGWRFRSSYRAAASAYQRALELIPSCIAHLRSGFTR